MPAFYNDIDPHCCGVLRRRIADGSLPPGIVDNRPIQEISPDELHGFQQVHLFAGIGGFALGARMAGIPDDFSMLTGGFPCQPYSSIGLKKGTADERDLWPEMFRLVSALKPRWVFGENVSGLDDEQFLALDRTCDDLESVNYEVGPPLEIPACAVDAPHKRTRIWIVAHSPGEPARTSGQSRQHGDVGHSEVMLRKEVQRHEPNGLLRGDGHFKEREWIEGADGKWRRIRPGVRLLSHGVPDRVAILKGYGNAIVPQVAARIMSAIWAAECGA